MEIAWRLYGGRVEAVWMESGRKAPITRCPRCSLSRMVVKLDRYGVGVDTRHAREPVRC